MSKPLAPLTPQMQIAPGVYPTRELVELLDIYRRKLEELESRIEVLEP